MHKRRLTTATAALALGAALTAGVSSAVTATAGAGSGPTRRAAPAAAPAAAPSAAPDFPTFVHLPTDQAAHEGVPVEWWYVVGHVNALGHRFGYEVTLIDTANRPDVTVAITDLTTGAFYAQNQTFSRDETSFSTTALDIRTPRASLSGPMNAMHLRAALPAGEIDLTLKARGPVLYDNGTGLMPFLGGKSYYYSLPSLASQGTLEVAHRTYPVTGESWLDRQWGAWDPGTAQKWTWMALQLSGGDRVDLWDMYAQGGESHYATVLRPDGTEEIVAVEPLADGTSRFWTSPSTGKRYGTRWAVRIPALNADLTVTAEPQGQEILANGGVFEGASSITGQYRGRPTTGQAYVEQFGNWAQP